MQQLECMCLEQHGYFVSGCGSPVTRVRFPATEASQSGRRIQASEPNSDGRTGSGEWRDIEVIRQNRLNYEYFIILEDELIDFMMIEHFIHGE